MYRLRPNNLTGPAAIGAMSAVGEVVALSGAVCKVAEVFPENNFFDIPETSPTSSVPLALFSYHSFALGFPPQRRPTPLSPPTAVNRPSVPLADSHRQFFRRPTRPDPELSPEGTPCL